MAVFLSVLKIIGIILLIILAVLILLILLLLFVPIRYKAPGYADIDDKDINADAYLTWLLHIVSVRLHFKKKGDATDKYLTLRVFGIKIKDFLAPKDNKEKKEKKEKKSKKDKKEKVDKSKDNKKDDDKPEAVLSTVTGDSDLSGGYITDDDLKEDPDDGLKDDEDMSLTDKIVTFIETIYDLILDKADLILDLFEDKADGISEKTEDMIKTIEAWSYVLSKEKTINAIGNVKDSIIKLLWHIRPRKGKLYGEVGMEDPAVTGKILGYYWMFIPLYAGIFTLVPFFDKKRIYLSGDLKGHIRLNHVLVIGWKFLFNKDFKYIRRLKDRVEYVKEHKK